MLILVLQGNAPTYPYTKSQSPATLVAGGFFAEKVPKKHRKAPKKPLLLVTTCYSRYD